MSLNHDNFIASANYLALDASLQWYIDAVGPHLANLERLAADDPAKLKALYRRDPVMQKLNKIGTSLRNVIQVART